MSEEPYVPKLIPLTVDANTPELILHRTLNKVERIKSVVIVIQWDDESVSLDWSKQKTSQLALAAFHLGMTAQKENDR